jgi:hypothetical protein
MSCQNNEYENGVPIDPITRELIYPDNLYKFNKICYNISTIENILTKGNRSDPFTEELIPENVYNDLNIKYDPEFTLEKYELSRPEEYEESYNGYGILCSVYDRYFDYGGYKNVLDGPSRLFLHGYDIGSKNLKKIVFPKHIMFLDLFNTNLTTITGIKFPKTLRVLFLSNNKIKSLKNVQFPKKLHSLILSKNNITSLKDVHFPKLIKSLDLDDNEIKSLKNVVFPDSITELNLGNNYIKSLLDFVPPKNLKKLFLYDNTITDQIFLKGVEIIY